jgi:hypothetical protein
MSPAINPPTAFDQLHDLLEAAWQALRPGSPGRPPVGAALSSKGFEVAHRLSLEAASLAASLGLPRDEVRACLSRTLLALHRLCSRDPDAAAAYNAAAGPLAALAAEVRGLAARHTPAAPPAEERPAKKATTLALILALYARAPESVGWTQEQVAATIERSRRSVQACWPKIQARRRPAARPRP